MTYSTEQEAFWAGSFGNDYLKRNQGENLLAAKTAFFARTLSKTEGVKSSLELGSNIGLNERALSVLFPGISMETVEINKEAADECQRIQNVKVFNGTIFDYETERKFDLTFTSGVLIHINPDHLIDVYKKLYDYSKKYILISEYYNPTPVEVNYRGNDGRLFKRDFAGELMDIYPDVQLVDYGFIYHRDMAFPQDDVTWFLMQKY